MPIDPPLYPHNMRYQTDLMTESDEKKSKSLDFGHILTSNYANYAEMSNAVMM